MHLNFADKEFELESNMAAFNEVNSKARSMKCPVHNRVVLAFVDTGFDGAATVWIDRGCCESFVKEMVKFYKKARIGRVVVKNGAIK